MGIESQSPLFPKRLGKVSMPEVKKTHNRVIVLVPQSILSDIIASYIVIKKYVSSLL